MKNLIWLFTLFFISILFLSSCSKESDSKNFNNWNVSPLSDFSIKPINGGALITYDIPKDPDILYIMAEFRRNGEIFTEKTSLYSDTLWIEGFNTTKEVAVNLYKVNKFEERSQVTVINFVPLISPIRLSLKSIIIEPDFGGVKVSWDNSTMSELGVRLLMENEKGIETKDMYFSSAKSGQHLFRGLEAEEAKFGISFEDKWGNISDTIWEELTPFFEIMIPKPYVDFRTSIPYDNISNLGASWPSDNLWDNIVGVTGNGWLSAQGSSGLSFTIDLGQVAKLSRLVIHPYNNQPYAESNFQRFEIWGVKEIDFDKLSDKPYWLDEFSVRNGIIHEVNKDTNLPEKTFKDDWVYLGSHKMTDYDDNTQEGLEGIDELIANGSEYSLPSDADPVRYIRIFFREVNSISPPPENNYVSMQEVTFYGDNTVPQN